MVDFTRGEAKAWSLEHIKDFYMCPLSPVTSDYKFDEEGLRENIEKYIEWGLNGLVIGGFISECWNVKLSDWFRYHAVVAEAAKGRIDLWTIILDPSVHQALEKMDYVEKLGYNGAEVINPVVQLRTDDEIYDYFKYMTDRSNLAICLYRTPVSGKVIGLDLMKRLADIDTVVAVKQGSLNRDETLMIRRNMREDFIVSDPSEYWFLDDLRRGGQVVWGELSYILYGKKRHLCMDYIKLAREGKWEEAYKAWEALQDVRTYYADIFLWEIVRTATYASALSNLKAWYEVIGLKAGPVIPPVRQPAPEKKEEIATKLKSMGVV